MSATWTAAAAPSRRVAAAVCLCLVGGSHALQSKPVVSPASIRPALHPATAAAVSDELHAAAVALLDSDEAGECDTTAVSTAGITAVPGHPSSPEAGGASSNANAARFALAAVAATYGSNYACIKLLDEWIGEPSMAALLLFTVALAAMLPALAYCGARDERYLQWGFAKDGLVIGAWFAAGYCAQAIALETSAAGVQAFLLALSVLVCPMLEALVDGKEQPRRVWSAAPLRTEPLGAHPEPEPCP